ncbi:MAG: alpha-1,4-glucan--maltose-1-phosphate maltosyltransferase [Lutibacter sp.]|uniref:alpha-1,4-glucan--maltose-1-phosphate maltosyltransferase n=1 Tax=Lutibacter sp. TaxID=1925666 RepID=UPI00179AB3E6|nr:alpha-1,4-glucan--maltose-1-phosphate maltosyltransferase [Lutibacter sp.]MBT8318040.1 alpha-1,4-glucan--maltose-1-phosphate maltosyltransferase [Lutibacter sp.]NNJ58900.1 alpha-1,4-glucan--maltose-1-phosphate maltosyltransferase [Lutibacter sp.]
MQNQKRVVIDHVSPQVNCGEFPIKRVVNQMVTVNSNVFSDGHDIIAASVLFKHETENKWSEVRMNHLHNDEWVASFVVKKQGFYSYKVQGWVDYALNWQHGITRKIDDNQHVKSELLEGVEYIKEIEKKVSKSEKEYLDNLKKLFLNEKVYDNAILEARGQKLKAIFWKYPQKKLANSSKSFDIYVDRLKAQFSTWYEFFPRSSSNKEGVHGTFKDCIKLLPRIANMGFDTLYFPPVHPIGEVNRKGKNNTTEAKKGDVGSAWGIGSKKGGHKDLHPQLGSISDFKALIKAAKKLGIEIAMDYALQTAPDHPWVKQHPDWFKWRPDGTVQYAENPPKKYQDILPIYFETTDFKNLWNECLDILVYWIECGINVFRVDNPHTKPYYFWNWIITEVKKKYPDVLFLAEAFTRPKVMEQLAKQGYTQSYTYFTWRNSKHELIEYMNDLTQTALSEYFKPNFWPNTPDINPFHLQGANESKYMQRYALAATLSSNIGIYGPVFEQMISDALLGKEEYLNSEKFQICNYNWEINNNLIRIITKINKIRQEQEALQQTNNIKFCTIENDQLMGFYKWNDSKTNELLIVISLDDHYTQQGTIQLPMHDLGIHHGQGIEVKDLLTGNSYHWNSEWNFVQLHPSLPIHIFRINK